MYIIHSFSMGHHDTNHVEVRKGFFSCFSKSCFRVKLLLKIKIYFLFPEWRVSIDNACLLSRNITLFWEHFCLFFISNERVKKYFLILLNIIYFLPAFWSCGWQVGNWWVHLYFNISNALFVSELSLWELNIGIWAEKIRSCDWQLISTKDK